MWADVNLHQSHWLGWSAHDLQGDSSSAILTANYGDRDSKKTAVIRVRHCTVFVAEQVKQHWCSSETILFAIEGVAFSVIRTTHHVVCTSWMFLQRGKKYSFEINRGDMASLSLKCQVPQQTQLQVYLHMFTFHRSGMREGYNRLSWGNHVWENGKRLSM